MDGKRQSRRQGFLNRVKKGINRKEMNLEDELKKKGWYYVS
ncbi:hypothetical protein OKW24_004740 [Peribacillus simplex]|nr:hypothetical protein [Peribacillus simplex]